MKTLTIIFSMLICITLTACLFQHAPIPKHRINLVFNDANGDSLSFIHDLHMLAYASNDLIPTFDQVSNGFQGILSAGKWRFELRAGQYELGDSLIWWHDQTESVNLTQDTMIAWHICTDCRPYPEGYKPPEDEEGN